MPQRTLGFAVVGCGRVSKNHLQALTGGTFPGRLVAVADIAADKARAAGEKYGVPWYVDYHELAARHSDVDVFDVATPTGLHAEHVIDLARHGRHVVVEKPMALRVEDARAMIDACRAAGGRLFVVKQNRFNPAVQAARAALEAGRFGKIVVGTARVRWKREQAYYEADDWHGTWALDGGVMSQQSSHHIDLLQWFLGPIAHLRCESATRVLDIDVEDTAAALFRFTSGALGVFEATVATRPEDLEASISLLGEKGSVIISGRAVNRVEYWKFTEPRPGDDEVTQRFSAEIPDVYGHGHRPYLADVTRAILDGTPALVEGEEGLKNVEILSALYESAACGGDAKSPGCPVVRSLLGRRG